MSQGENRTACDQRDAVGLCGKECQVGEGVEQLASVAKMRVEQGDITYPDRGETDAVKQADEFGLACKHAYFAAIEAQRQEDSKTQGIFAEHALVARMPGESRCRGANQCCRRCCSVVQVSHRYLAHGPVAGSGINTPRCTAGRRAIRACHSLRCG